MLFEGQQLRELIARTPNEIELRNTHGRCYRTLSRGEALTLNLDLFIAKRNQKIKMHIPQDCCVPTCFRVRIGNRGAPTGAFRSSRVCSRTSGSLRSRNNQRWTSAERTAWRTDVLLFCGTISGTNGLIGRSGTI